MKKFCFIIIFIFVLLIPLTSSAFFHKVKDSVIVAKEEIISGDLITFANIIDIKGNVDGDVIALGSKITITGRVSGDVIAAGSDIVIGGDVFGDVRVAGGSVKISGIVEKNLNVYAGNVTLATSSDAQKNAYLSGSLVRSDGKIAGRLIAKASKVVANGTVGKDADITVQGDGKLTLMPDANIAGSLTYRSNQKDQLEIQEGAEVLGDITFQKFETRAVQGTFKEVLTLGKVIYLFGMLVIGLLLITLVPKMVREVSAKMLLYPWRDIFYGFAIFGLTPLFIFLLLFTIIGIPLALMLMPIYLIAIYISKVMAGIALGLFLFKQLNQAHEVKSLIWPMVLGLVVLVIVSNVPMIGWFVSLVAILWGLGACFLFKKELLKQWR